MNKEKQIIELKIGDYLVVRDIKILLAGAKTQHGRNYIIGTLSRIIELHDIILITIERISSKKYRIDEIITEMDSVVLDKNEFTFDASWYDISKLRKVVSVNYYNPLLGERAELRMVGDYE